MRTMINVRKCGSLRSMRHVSSRPYEDKSIPHLTLYVQQMKRTKLLKEKEVLLNRLMEVEKEMSNIDSLMLELRPKLGLPEIKRKILPVRPLTRNSRNTRKYLAQDWRKSSGGMGFCWTPGN